MKYLSICTGVIAGFILTLPIAAGAAGSPVKWTGNPGRGIARPVMTVEQHGKKRYQPSSSSLSDRGYYYRYQGKPVKLLKITDRVSITYRDAANRTTPSFKNRQSFRRATFRPVNAGKHRREVMTFDPTILSSAAAGTGTAVDAAVTELNKDPSVAWATSVYFDPNTRKEVIFTERIGVKFTESGTPALRKQVALLLDATLDREIMPSVFLYNCTTGSNTDALLRCRRLENIPGIEWAEPEMITRIEHCFTPNDQLFNRQWHLNNTGSNSTAAGADLDVTTAWDIQRMGDPSIAVAILDDGVDLQHPDLTFAPNDTDCYNADDDPSPEASEDNHGTAVAGVVGAIGDNTTGVAGVAPGVSILPVKISQDHDFISSMEIAEAITWSYKHGADILNNSWGGSSPTNWVTQAIRDASTLGRNGRGCPVFFSAGNHASSFTTYSFILSSSTLAYAFVYQKNGSVSAGDDRIIIDNVWLLSGDGYTISSTETFANGLPSGWSTSGGLSGSVSPDASISGWSPTTSTFQSGFGDQTAMCSGTITDGQWTELRMPIRTYNSGEKLRVNVCLSTEEAGDSLRMRAYNVNGGLVWETAVASGIFTPPSSDVHYPASSDSSIAVGSSTDQDYRSDYSQYDLTSTGKTVDFLAPSGGGWNGIYTTDRVGTEGYSTTDYASDFSGTSSACPAAAGVAALILSRNQYLSRNKVLEVMRATCDKIGGVTYTNGTNNEYGYGRLNAHTALSNLPPAITDQNLVSVIKNGSVTLTTADLQIFDAETPDGPFTLTVHSGTNYSFSGTTVTPASNFTGTLTVPVSVNDGTYESDPFTLSIDVRATNTVPVINSQSQVTILEDGSYQLSSDDLTITDPDDSGPFTIAATSATGTNYTVTGSTVHPAADFNGTLTVPITASDGLGVSAPFDLIITVTSVNDAPSFTSGGDIEINEDNGAYSESGWATAISSGPANESTQSRAFIVSATNSGLFASVPSISLTGTLSFTPAPDANGTSTVTIRMYDGGGTANGGVDSTGPTTFTITVLPVNDAPSFTAGGMVTVNEDAGAQTETGWATGITEGPANEAGQGASFTVVAADPDLFSVQPSLTDAGDLSFTPAANRFGSSDITVQLIDKGGTDNGGINASTIATETITINPVNDAPSFTAGSNVTVDEDAPAQNISWATDISAGPEETGQTVSFSLTTDLPALFSSVPSINAAGDLSFTPANNASGVATVAVRMHDDGGTDRNGVDSGGESSFTITIFAVNDPPTFTAGEEVTVSEDAGLQTFTDWATIGKGASDESTQSVSISLTVSNPALFSGTPTLTDDGTLSFTPAADQSGSATLTPVLTDDGGTSNGGVNTSNGTAFTITVTPVNDAPSFTAGSDIHVYEDTGACTIPDWATALNPGPGENDQELMFSLTTDNNSLFASLPELDDQGTLTFTPAPDASGGVLVTVRLYDDGGTVDEGVDSSAATQFSITVTAVNDLPEISIAGRTDPTLGEESVLTITATDPDGIIPDLSTGTLPSWATFVTTAGSGTATLTFAPQTDTGEFSITVTADDLILPVDTVIVLRVHAVPTGAIDIVGAPSSATVALYATAGWIGKTVLTGSGRIEGLVTGNYLIAVRDTDARTEYYSSEVVPSAIDTITVAMRPPVAVALTAPDTLSTSDGPLTTGELVSAVIDDADNDNQKDIMYIGAGGRITLCNGTSNGFASPDLLHTVNSGKTALRCVDWNEDGINDLLTVNIIGSVRIALGTGTQQYRSDSTLFTTAAGCTGVELVRHNASTKGFYFGFSDGTVVYNYPSAGNQRTSLTVTDENGQPIDAGDNANAIVFDITGDGTNELLVGNGSGEIEVFKLLSVDRVRSLGSITVDGAPLIGKNGIMLSTTYGTSGELPSVIYSDGNGSILRADAKPLGDINDDGSVDILDLQQLGIHWGQRDTDTGWSGAANLQVQTGSTDPQTINVLDLQVLANYWGVQK
jgi:hypothetical protein